MLKAFIYLPIWFLKAKFLGKKAPLQTVLFLTDYCNLKCKHCTESGHAGTIMKSFSKIKEELQYSYEQGARFVDLEGGEPTLWKEGKRSINDVIRLAKKIGFYSVTVTTNAQRPFQDLEADSIWVSLDGLGKYHDAVRGDGAFENLVKNIASSHHPAISVNMAINRLNKDSVVETIRYVKKNPHIKMISLNFHTPYPGTEHMKLPQEEREQLIDQIIKMKKSGYPIMNSVSGLKYMKHNHFKKECWVSNFILTDGTRLSECPGKSLGICKECGFSMAGEMHSVMQLKPDTILAGLKLRVFTK